MANASDYITATPDILLAYDCITIADIVTPTGDGDYAKPIQKRRVALTC